ncbi:MAG: hypothetical protein AAFO89_09750 [Planctomycetota bacterium]
MNGAKPWQIALIVIGLLAGVVGVVFALASHGPPKTTDQLLLVDVGTGDLYRIRTANRTLVMPMKRPGSDERMLFPVEELEDGSYRISGRYMDTFRARTTETPPVDRGSGEVTTSDTDAEWID